MPESGFAGMDDEQQGSGQGFWWDCVLRKIRQSPISYSVQGGGETSKSGKPMGLDQKRKRVRKVKKDERRE